MQAQTMGSNGDMTEMQDKAMEGLKEARGTIESFARENPRVAIGVAVGIGFVLGGGLTPRLLFGLGALAARTVARDYVRNQLGGLAGGVLGGGSADAE